MKKLLLLICLFANSAFLFGQSVKLSVEGGANLSSFGLQNYTTGSGSTQFQRSDSYSSIVRYHAGAFVSFENKNITIQPGLVLIDKGDVDNISTVARYDPNNIVTTNIKETLVLRYLELPVNILYHFQVPNLGKISVGGGPYLGYGFTGVYNDKGTLQVGSGAANAYNQSGSIEFGNAETLKTPIWVLMR